jgi:hypothetical protein
VVGSKLRFRNTAIVGKFDVEESDILRTSSNDSASAI